MAVSPYFHHIDAKNEQDLYHDLATEMIQLAGIDVHYMKVEQVNDINYNPVFGENRFEKLGQSTVIEMYPKDFEQPYGNDDLYAKFGLSAPNTCTFLVGVRRFEGVFGHRPREGDYIYVPLWSHLGPDDIFRIAKVDIEDFQFKTLGSPIYYFIKCERAKFSHQSVSTGEPVLDAGVVEQLNNNSVANDLNADNDPVQQLSDDFISFDETNPFGTP